MLSLKGTEYFDSIKSLSRQTWGSAHLLRYHEEISFFSYCYYKVYESILLILNVWFFDLERDNDTDADDILIFAFQILD